MQSIAVWLASLVPGLVSRVLLALGMGVVVYSGIDFAMGTLTTQVTGYLHALPASILQLAGLAGLGDALGIVLGAIAYRTTMYVLMQGRKIAGLGA